MNHCHHNRHDDIDEQLYNLNLLADYLPSQFTESWMQDKYKSPVDSCPAAMVAQVLDAIVHLDTPWEVPINLRPLWQSLVSGTSLPVLLKPFQVRAFMRRMRCPQPDEPFTSDCRPESITSDDERILKLHTEFVTDMGYLLDAWIIRLTQLQYNNREGHLDAKIVAANKYINSIKLFAHWCGRAVLSSWGITMEPLKESVSDPTLLAVCV